LSREPRGTKRGLSAEDGRRRRPPQAGLEVVEKLLTSKPSPS
jgi:hypothetical protein